MKKLLLATLLAFLSAGVSFDPSASAQTTESSCTEKTARALTVRGLRLGMTADEVLALIPQATRRDEIKAGINAPPKASYGSSSAAFLDDQLDSRAPSSKWVGVQRLNLRFFDGKLVGFYVQYFSFREGGAMWNSTDEFIAKLAEPLHLPNANYWDAVSERPTTKKLQCGLITITVRADEGGSLELSDDSYVVETKRRAEVERDARRHAFKP